MEIDEIKRCAWPWAACTVLGHRGGVGPAPRAPGGGAPAAVRAPGPAVPPTSPLSARAREGVRGHAHGRAVWLSAPQGQRRGLEAVWALTRMPLPCAAWACGRDNRGRAPGRASGMPAHGRTVWRIAHRGLARGVNCVGRGRRWPLPFGVGRVTSCRRHSRPPARSPAFGPFTDTVRPPSACPSLPRRRPSRLPRSRSPAPGPSGAGWP